MFLPENPGAPGGLPWSLAAPPVIDNRTQTKVPKILPPDGKILGFSRQTPVFPGFAGVLETRQNPGKQGVNHYKNTLTPLRFSVLPDSPFIKTGNSNRARKGNREHEKNFNRPPQVPLSSRRNTQETRRCNPAETGRVIGKTRVNPGMGKPKPPLSYPGQEHTGACRPAQQGARNTQAPANGAYEGSHSTVPATGRQPPPPIWQALIWQAQNDWRQQAKFV